MKGDLLLKGRFKVVHRDAQGKVKSVDYIDNLVVNEGINYILNAACHGDTQISTWYFLPWTTNTTPAATHTYASPGNTEATTEISEANRQEWVEGSSTSQSLTNATAATITAASSVTIYGFGIAGGGSAASTKGDTSGGGTLLASGMFSSSKTLAANETLDLTYTLNGSSS